MEENLCTDGNGPLFSAVGHEPQQELSPDERHRQLASILAGSTPSVSTTSGVDPRSWAQRVELGADETLLCGPR